ncbi:aromatic-L-amino-acid decarboxylase-like [Anneissia japonica]|uniref:aromatic-L-amino-acid decarboxylase-like n=1 Tax=Anneissia japonica TaxID=1529436 RepID=UPI00142564C5|nr:aromatic-L-amino-acid decarboxylase-like [Anneissia japonica]
MGRRFRSLKMWFVFRLFGIEELQNHVRKHVQLAHHFETLVMSDSRFEIVSPVVLGLVSFRLKGPDKRNEELLKAINESGKLHMGPSNLKGRYHLRFAICAASTETKHVQFAWEVIKGITDTLGK